MNTPPNGFPQQQAAGSPQGLGPGVAPIAGPPNGMAQLAPGGPSTGAPIGNRLAAALPTAGGPNPMIANRLAMLRSRYAGGVPGMGGGVAPYPAMQSTMGQLAPAPGMGQLAPAPAGGDRYAAAASRMQAMAAQRNAQLAAAHQAYAAGQPYPGTPPPNPNAARPGTAAIAGPPLGPAMSSLAGAVPNAGAAQMLSAMPQQRMLAPPTQPNYGLVGQ